MREKEAIERATAEGFLTHYNERFGTDFRVARIADAPDVVCTDSRGRQLNLEITVTEDRPLDVAALLGRSDTRSIENLRAHVDRVSRGEELPQFSSLSEEVCDNLVARIKAKMLKDYGRDVALVVRDSSPVDWDWDDVLPCVRSKLSSDRSPFSRGIWILSRTKERLFQVT